MSDVAVEERTLLDFEEDRYAALKLIDWFDIKRVQNARVLVIGAGAIGNEVLKNLALMGVGNIFIYDRDTIEMSNLTRSILFRAADRGKGKAETAALALREINPDIRVEWRTGDIRFDLGLGFIRRMEVVIGCLDNRAARIWINGACFSMGIPWVDAGIGQLDGQVRAFVPGQGACYECLFTQEELDVAVPCNRLASVYASEGKIPTTPTIASIVAGVQVQEALKLLDLKQWDGRTLAGKEFSFNGTIGDVSISGLPRRADCLAHQARGDDRLVMLPRAVASETTVEQLLEMAQKHAKSKITIELNFELAVMLVCAQCGLQTDIMKPLGTLFHEDSLCPKCEGKGKLVLTNWISELSEHFEQFRHMTLGSLNVAALDILTGYDADGTEYYFELSGDAKQLSL